MIIGIPKEIKKNECRVAATPSAAAALIKRGHTVLVEPQAGLGSGYPDEAYVRAGAQITPREALYKRCDMLYKVKEIEASEYELLHEDQIVFTYLHSNAHSEMTEVLLDRGITGICYEDVDDENGDYPMLAPMSILAGKGGFLAALHFSQSVHGGRGLLLNRIVGVATPDVTIIGCGWSGVGAAELAAAFGNRVTMLDINKKAMDKAREKLPVNVEFLFSNRENLETCLKRTDVLINCILWPKTRQDHLVNREELKLMKRGALIVDVACDEAGAIETCRSTSHDDPVYVEEGVLHYAVDNIPSGFAETASQMLSECTLPYALEIANRGVVEALRRDPHLRRGLTTYKGQLTLVETADKHGIPYVDPLEAIERS
ncbi:alanine dehydrogenase [Acidaminobacter hydrogenoformans]|uniref:alanine dehydrogenase n=1 Tax=Acidaminobacter hydrogenoformans DSM 2784 TaxID=1120920 RepID=A0A1G5RPU6_9FIRM|nr:alanine dehydrogenase [Acidaminobacter hydrogenoformans]SCZ76024.1 alanine dehydrogenase [Acidaminobacter hydrogenoformans DSM 2784]